MNNVPSWSYTALTQFENCPHQYRLAKVDKVLPFVESEAMRDGNVHHQYLEDRFAKGKKLPDSLSNMEALAAKLERNVISGKLVDLQPELEFVLDRNMQPVAPYGQRTPKPFFLKTAWFRAKLDLYAEQGTSTALVTDWKFGKYRPDNDQLELFAGVVFKYRPAVERVLTSFVYPRLNKTKNMTFFRSGAPESEGVSPKSEQQIWASWLQRVNRLDQAYKTGHWPARPTGLCGWCDATPQQCPHSRK